MGDFNCDFLVKKPTHRETMHLKSLFKSFHFTQTIDSPTRVTSESSTCIDLVANNHPQNISHSCVYPSCLSDHELVYVIPNLNNKKFPLVIKRVKNYSKYNRDRSCEDLRSVEWECPSGLEDVDSHWQHFMDLFICQLRTVTLLWLIRKNAE
jgi:hypothetical protein